MASATQEAMHRYSVENPEKFWREQAEYIHWHKKPSKSLVQSKKRLASGVEHKSWSWFPDGEISTSYNCVDRHVLAGNGDSTAIIWESPVTGKKEKWTYKALQEEVETLAGVLREEGVSKGDVVMIYMPMIPAALVATLAIVRLGAVHATVFGGFASTALANRMEAAKPKLIMTASCGIEGNKGPINYKPLVEGAIEKSSWKPSRTIIWQRDESQWRPINHVEGNQRCWQKLVKSAKSRGIKAEAVPVKSSDGLYIIYTSGTTGSPKGILREAGGHAVGLSLSARHMFDLHGPGDVMFCASDIGWVVGHSYIIYSPLLVGATTLLFEGKPVYTPDAGIFWRLIEEHKVKTLSTAPTALRAIHKYDEDFFLFKQVAERGGLKSLQGLFLVGERSEPSIVTRFQDLLTKYAAPEAKVIDNWWSSESGSPMTGLRIKSPRSAIKPGSAGKLMPGFDVRIVNDEGEEQKPGSMGNVVLKTPLGPTAFTTLFKDPERFYKGYLRRFNDKWMDTGDAGYIDENGYVHIMARSDDIINVAAHRFSTGAIEQVVLSHPDVVEACVVGIPDTFKGHLPFAFIQPAHHLHGELPANPPPELFKSINALVREQIGAVASLGGMIQGRHMIPKTRSGKTMRRVLREMLENAVKGEFDKPIPAPPTIENPQSIPNARECIREFFKNSSPPKAKL